MLTKGEAHAASRGIEPGSLLRAHLADDMYPLAVQVHWVAEGARLAVDRLLGVVAPPVAAEAKSFAQLHERIEATLVYLGTVEPGTLEAGLDRTIELPQPGGSKTMRGDRFLTEFAIPSFYFHLTTAYGILRHEGVALRKGDFLGM